MQRGDAAYRREEHAFSNMPDGSTLVAMFPRHLEVTDKSFVDRTGNMLAFILGPPLFREEDPS